MGIGGNSCKKVRNYISLLLLNTHQNTPDTTTEMTKAMAKPKGLVSIPFTRFIPKSEAISVGNIMRMDTEVKVRITVFMLLLIMLE